MVGLTVGLSLFGVCVITVHTFALYLLRRTPPLRSNHKLYLYHISVLEISLTGVSLGTLFLNILTNKDKKMEDYGFICVGVLAMPWTLVIMAFTLDRFLQVYLSLKYHTYVTKRRQNIVIAFCYLIGALELGVVIVVKNVSASSGSYSELIRSYLYQVNGIALLLVDLIVFSYIYWQRNKLMQKRTNLHSLFMNRKLSAECENVEKVEKVSENQQSARRAGIFVPCIIVGVFVGLSVVPCLVFLHSSSMQRWKYLDHIWRFLWYAEFFTQVFIYALMDVDIRNKLMRVIRLNQQFNSAHSSRRRILGGPSTTL